MASSCLGQTGPKPPEKGEIVPISELLKYGCFKGLSDDIERDYYHGHHLHYRPELLLKLAFIKFFRKVSYDKLIDTLYPEDIENLLTKDELELFYHGRMNLPSGKTVFHFLHYRLGDEGIKKVMRYFADELIFYLNQHANRGNWSYLIVDSTPLEASRYSDADFNPHYEIKMSKAHIISFFGYPLLMRYSDGNQNDAPYGRVLIDDVAELKRQPKADAFLADKGYDNFKTYAAAVQKLHTKPYIQIRENAIIAKGSLPDAIKNRVNKLWKEGGNPKESIEKNLEYLFNYDTKYWGIVGGYYRNQSLENMDELNAALTKRGLCEQRHAQYKELVKFDIKNYRKYLREFNVTMNFITMQALFIVNLQNGLLNTQFENYY